MAHKVILQMALYGFLYWSSAAAQLSCGSPGRPVDGFYLPMLDTSIYPPGSEIQYYCYSKQLLFGPSKRVCMASGSWSDSIPLCEHPIRVQSALQSTNYEGHSAMMALDGIYSTCSTSQLQDLAYWTAFLPEMSTVKAVRITLPQGDHVDLEVVVKNEDGVSIVCGGFSGYTGISQLTKVIKCPPNTGGSFVHVKDNIKIMHYFQLCEVEIFVEKVTPCLSPDLPNNGFGNKKSSGSITSFDYFCSQGYHLIGAPKSICQPNGTWYPPAPVCTPISCDHPEILQNGNITYHAIDGRILFGGVANYSCNPGFILEGDTTRKCIKENTWLGNMPVCIAKECDTTLPTVINGVLEAETTHVYSEVLLRCNKGYKPLKTDRVVCLPSGEWNTEFVTCVPVQCEDVQSVPHGSVELLDESTYYGSHVRVICEPGYTIQGTVVRKCLEDGTWENLTNACTEVFCELHSLSTVEGGKWIPVFGHALPKPGAAMTLQCHSGFQLTGTLPTTTCLLNGTWSPTSATCMQITAAAAATWKSKWSPSVVIIAAISAGVGTALCILCIVAVGLMLKKRHHPQSTTTVFHVESSLDLEDCKDYMASPEDHYYNTALYEEVPEAKNPPVKPRKPYSPLPVPPLETEPFYAQPFETGSSYSLNSCKTKQKDDFDAAHVYAEPVVSYCFSKVQKGKTMQNCSTSVWRTTLENIPSNEQEDSIYEQLREIQSSQLQSSEKSSNFLLVPNTSETSMKHGSLIQNTIYVTSLTSISSNETLSSMNPEATMVENAIFLSDSDSST